MTNDQNLLRRWYRQKHCMRDYLGTSFASQTVLMKSPKLNQVRRLLLVIVIKIVQERDVSKATDDRVTPVLSARDAHFAGKGQSREAEGIARSRFGGEDL